MPLSTAASISGSSASLRSRTLLYTLNTMTPISSVYRVMVIGELIRVIGLFSELFIASLSDDSASGPRITAISTGASAAMIDVVFMIILGLIGFAMRRFDVPLAPVLIAVILGPLAESSLREAMNNSENNPMTLISSPITITLYTLLIGVIVFSVYSKVRLRKDAEDPEIEAAVDSGKVRDLD